MSTVTKIRRLAPLALAMFMLFASAGYQSSRVTAAAESPKERTDIASTEDSSEASVVSDSRTKTRNAGLQIALTEEPYLARRAKFKTNLLKKGRSPHSRRTLKPMKGYREVTYRSGNLRLRAWVYVPEGITKPRPGIVHFHGGFGISDGHFHTCRPFQNAGFVVMIPALRGENKNPGDFEMFLAEVDDGLAATKWLSKRRFVDPKRVYAFGHSGGGIIAAMLSLVEDAPIRHSGSCGGLYDVALFDGLKGQVPFDLSNQAERQMRVLPGNIAWMKRDHYAYIGDADFGVHAGTSAAKREVAEIEKAGKPSHLKIISQPGNHYKSVPPSMKHYIELIRAEEGKKSNR
jgi:acetyl esterase/lipase